MKRILLIFALFLLFSPILYGQTIIQTSAAQFAWDPVTQWGPDAIGSHYQLWISDVSGGTYAPIGPAVPVGTEVVQITVGQCAGAVCASNNVARYYVVTAENSVGLVSGYSNEVAMQFQIGPAAPANLTVSEIGP